MRSPAWKRRLIFLYTVGWFLGLLALAILYFKTGTVGTALPKEFRGLPVYTAWFGALGGVAISFKGVYDWPPLDEKTGADLWTGRWPLWYIGRPFSGLLIGVVTFTLLRAAYPSGKPFAPTFEVAAFVLATQDARFFGFVYEVGKLILHTPDEAKKGAKGRADDGGTE